MTAFSFFFPIYGLVIIDPLFKNVKEARQGWLSFLFVCFFFWREDKGGLSKFKAKYKC